jgi:transposase InsO family protein
MARLQHDGCLLLCATAGRNNSEIRGSLKYSIRTRGTVHIGSFFTGVLLKYGIQISMDGRNRCLDNIYHRTVPAYGKYEDIYLRRYAAVMELRKMLKSFISYYNTERAHQRLHDQTPDAIRFSRIYRKV